MISAAETMPRSSRAPRELVHLPPDRTVSREIGKRWRSLAPYTLIRLPREHRSGGFISTSQLKRGFGVGQSRPTASPCRRVAGPDSPSSIVPRGGSRRWRRQSAGSQIPHWSKRTRLAWSVVQSQPQCRVAISVP